MHHAVVASNLQQSRATIPGLSGARLLSRACATIAGNSSRASHLQPRIEGERLRRGEYCSRFPPLAGGALSLPSPTPVSAAAVEWKETGRMRRILETGPLIGAEHSGKGLLTLARFVHAPTFKALLLTMPTVIHDQPSLFYFYDLSFINGVVVISTSGLCDSKWADQAGRNQLDRLLSPR